MTIDNRIKASNANLNKLPCVKLLATGGTIAMKADKASGAYIPAIAGDALLAAVPDIARFASVEVKNVFNIPSAHLGPNKWLILHSAVAAAIHDKAVDAVIISHGTDTLEETAYFLSLTIDTSKPIILFGAQRGSSDADSDGPRNLLHAVRVAASAQAQGKGVMVVMNGQINAARDVRKTHTTDVESFQSGDVGFLGRVDGDAVSFYRQPLYQQTIPLSGALKRVDIVAMYAGADGALLTAAVDAGAKGIVIAAVGAGNVNPALFTAVKVAIAAGVAVVVSTRVPNGRVQPIYGFEGGGKDLIEAGAIFANDLSPQKARILLMLALQEASEPAALIHLFS
ncbi:MAG: asparaginase [Cellvibrionales bacterium]|nr:asparaginase [Cellvibrionales bacterium]